MTFFGKLHLPKFNNLKKKEEEEEKRALEEEKRAQERKEKILTYLLEQSVIEDIKTRIKDKNMDIFIWDTKMENSIKFIISLYNNSIEGFEQKNILHLMVEQIATYIKNKLQRTQRDMIDITNNFIRNVVNNSNSSDTSDRPPEFNNLMNDEFIRNLYCDRYFYDLFDLYIKENEVNIKTNTYNNLHINIQEHKKKLDNFENNISEIIKVIHDKYIEYLKENENEKYLEYSKKNENPLGGKRKSHRRRTSKKNRRKSNRRRGTRR